jgi:hypothetical protein
MCQGCDELRTVVTKEVSRIASLASGVVAGLEEFARDHGNAILLGRAVRPEAATDLASISSDCGSILQAATQLNSTLVNLTSA